MIEEIRIRDLGVITEARLPLGPGLSVVTGETGATAQWAAINCGLGADIFREAAAMTTQISGELIPSGVRVGEVAIVGCEGGGEELAAVFGDAEEP